MGELEFGRNAGRLPACLVAADGSSGRPARVLHPVSRSKHGTAREMPHGRAAACLQSFLLLPTAATVYLPCFALLTNSLAPLTCMPFAPCFATLQCRASHAGVTHLLRAQEVETAYIFIMLDERG